MNNLCNTFIITAAMFPGSFRVSVSKDAPAKAREWLEEFHTGVDAPEQIGNCIDYRMSMPASLVRRTLGVFEMVESTDAATILDLAM